MKFSQWSNKSTSSPWKLLLQRAGPSATNKPKESLMKSSCNDYNHQVKIHFIKHFYQPSKTRLFFWPHHSALWDPSSPTRVPNLGPPAVEAWSPNHWTAREFPKIRFLKRDNQVRRKQELTVKKQNEQYLKLQFCLQNAMENSSTICWLWI